MPSVVWLTFLCCAALDKEQCSKLFRRRVTKPFFDTNVSHKQINKALHNKTQDQTKAFSMESRVPSYPSISPSFRVLNSQNIALDPHSCHTLRLDQNIAFTKQKLNYQDPAFTMAEAFLYDLLQMQNSVQNKDETCAICMEGYGTLCRETGTIEVEMRLPCNHSIGSACIATWLKEHNSCPICRREFFPAQPRPYLEHGILDGHENGEIEDEGDRPSVRELNHNFCAQLGLDMQITVVSGLIIQKLVEMERWNEDHTEWCIVAVSIYIASFLAGEPRSAREVAAVTRVDAHHIRYTYDLIYPEREQIVDADFLSLLDNAFDEVDPLNWPAPSMTDEEIEYDHVSELLRVGCEEGSDELRLDDRFVDFSYSIADHLHDLGFMSHLHPRWMTAIGLFMASHMLGSPVTARRVAEVVGTSESIVRNAYRRVYSCRYQLVGEEWFGRDDAARAIGRLPSP